METRNEPIVAQAPSAPNRSNGSAELVIQGWSSILAIIVTSLLLVQSLTGVWIFFAPFSLSSQLQLLLHVGAGLLMLVPYAVYQTWHLWVWGGQKATAVMVLGYLLMVLVLACVVSGLVLTWQSWFGPKIAQTWHLVHLVSGFSALVLVAVHLPLALLRRRHLASATPRFRRSVRRHVAGVLGTVLVSAVLIGLLAAAWPAGPGTYPPPDDYTLPEYVGLSDEYRGSPFAPSNARTAGDLLIDPALLSNSQSCGVSGCHEQIYAEWEPSAHRFSAMNAPFQAVQREFAAERGAAETRYCAGCHDPISLFAGSKDIHELSLSAPGMQEGCSCVVCHSIDRVDQRGNADYVLVPPQPYLWEHEAGWRKAVSNFLIRAYPRQHLADYDRPVLRSPEFCGVCHKQYIPEELNRFGVSDGQNQYDEWRNSHWNCSVPDQNLSCVDCHMRLVHDSTDPSRGEAGAVRRSPDDGAHRHHGTIATNFYMPQILKLPGWEQHVAETKEWMRGETVIPEIAHLWPEGPVASLELFAAESAIPGETIDVRAVVTNRKAGHNLTTGPLDFMQCWIHLRVSDADGRRLGEWGQLHPETRELMDEAGRVHQVGNSRREGTLVLEGMPVDRHGELLRRHELWNKAGGKGARTIFPNYSDSQLYVFQVPPDARGPLTVEADLNYRRYRQEFLDLVLPELEATYGPQPLVTKASARIQIALMDQATAVDSQAATALAEQGDLP